MLQKYLDEAGMAMEKVYVSMQGAFSKINIGRATPALIQDIKVEYYDNLVPISQLATISTSDAQTLVIQPWESRAIVSIEKAIQESQLGLTTRNDGRMIMVTVPKPSEERRKSLVKLMKSEGEKAKIMIRNIRRDYKELMKSLPKDGITESEIKRLEKKIQQLTDDYNEKVVQFVQLKEANLMSV